MITFLRTWIQNMTLWVFALISRSFPSIARQWARLLYLDRREAGRSAILDDNIRNRARTGAGGGSYKFPQRIRVISEVARVLLEQYRCSGPVDLLAVATMLSRAHLRMIMVSDVSEIWAAETLLADTLRAEYELYHNLGALEESIKYCEKAIARCTSPLNHSYIPQIGLAQSLHYRFTIFGNKDDCKMALSLLEDVTSDVSYSVMDEVYHARVTLVNIFVRTTASVRSISPVTSQDMTDMLLALDQAQTLITLLPRSLQLFAHIVEMRLLCELSLSMSPGSPHAFKQASKGVQIGQYALRACPWHAAVLHHRVLMELFTLYRAIEQRHMVHGDSHIHTAIEVAERMQQSALSERNGMAAWDSQSFRALAIFDRAIGSEDLGLMESSVDAFRETASSCPSQVRKRYAVNDLAYALGLYFDRSGRISALDELIEIRHMGDEYLLNTAYLATNIAEAILMRARITDDRSSSILISQAVELCLRRKATPGFASYLKTEETGANTVMIIASRMLLKMGLTPSLSPDEIVVLASEGLESTSDRSSRTDLVLAAVESWIFMGRKNTNDYFLLKAESMLQLELSKDFMASSLYMVELVAAQADLKVARWDITQTFGNDHLLLEAWALFQSAVSHSAKSGHDKERFQVCLRWASHATERGHTSAAFRAYQCAVEVLPRVVFLGENIIGRIEALRQVNGLASACVTTSLTMNDVAAAVQFLELTRGILWLQSSTIGAGKDCSLPPNFQERFSDACSKLEATHDLAWTAKRCTAEELEVITNEIRGLPKFKRFLLPPLLEDIINALKMARGVAVILNPIKTGCEVIILGTSQGYSVLRLEKLSQNQVLQLAVQFSTPSSGARAAQGNETRAVKVVIPESESFEKSSHLDLLASLWSTIVCPILREIDVPALSSSRLCNRRRLWWCPVGVLNSVPLHAAGIYRNGSCEHVSTYAVSSYVPTLSALHRILTGSFKAPELGEVVPHAKILLVAQPSMTDLPHLPHVQVEVDLVRESVPLDRVLGYPRPQGMTVNEVLAEVPNATALHFACHGHQDQNDPLNSGFDLQDGRLTLGKLMQVKATNAQFAYLSACESAGLDEGRPDEGLNLASTMIALGFKSVVATLWTMHDKDGPFMASRIYRRIFRGGELDMAAIPYAVDDAVRELRESGVPPSRWATYVHFGV